MKKLDKLIKEALLRQFEIVGETYSPDYCRQEGWYLKHSWSEAQQEDFSAWLQGRYRKLGLSSEYARKQAGWYLLAYGWTTPLPEVSAESPVSA